MPKTRLMETASVRSLRVSALVMLLFMYYSDAASAASGDYWLRFDDLRMPRPKSDESGLPKAKENSSPETVNGGGPAKHDKVPPEQAAETAERRLKIGGDYKLLSGYSHTPDAENKPYTQMSARLRLKLNYRFLPSLEANVEHDTEILAGSYVGTNYFQSHKNGQNSQYWSDGGAWADNQDFYATQRLFRASLKLSSEVADVTVGRQRIPLGTGRFWSALDMLNPVNPLQVERDEFTGVDAVLVEHGIGSLAKLSAIYAPDPARVSDRWVMQYRTHVRESDVTLTYGKYWEDHVIGADFATQIGDAGLRGEAVYTIPKLGSHYRKALLGLDYAFANTLAFSVEAYYSDRSTEDGLAQLRDNPQLGLVQPLGNAYFGLAVGYDFTPLTRLSTYILNNLKDGSGVFYPTLSYSISDNSSFLAGAQFFFGGPGSEYGRGRNLYYARYQEFF